VEHLIRTNTISGEHDTCDTADGKVFQKTNSTPKVNINEENYLGRHVSPKPSTSSASNPTPGYDDNAERVRQVSPTLGPSGCTYTSAPDMDQITRDNESTENETEQTKR